MIKKITLIVLFVQLLCALSYAQESTGTNYYYNDFEGGSLGSTATSGGASTIAISNSSPLAGSYNLASTNTSTSWGYKRWSFFNSGSGMSLTSKSWEWEITYLNTSSSSPGEIDQATPDTDSWRYWLIANAASGSENNGMQGVYITQSGSKLYLRYKKSSTAGSFDNLLSVDISNNVKYQIRVVRNAEDAWKIYLLNINTNTTTVSGIGWGDKTHTTYNYSYLESKSTALNRFKWDNLNMYSLELNYVAMTAASNGITQGGITPGQSNVIPYGIQAKVRGDVEFGRIRFGSATDSQAIFESGKLYKSTDDYFSLTDTFLFNISVYNNGTSQMDLSSTEYYYSPGNRSDGSLVAVSYYFLVLQARNPFYSSAPSSISFYVSATANDNYASFYGERNPVSTSTESGTTASNPTYPVTYYDWTGKVSSDWDNKNNFTQDGANSASDYPKGSYDVVRFGVSAFTGQKNQPIINVNVSAGQFIFGGTDFTSLTVSSGKTVNLSTGITLNTSATVPITGPGSINILPTGGVNFTSGGSLSVNSATTFTLKSDATGTAYVGNTGTTTISGTFRVERFMKGGSNSLRGYRLIGSPTSISSSNQKYNVLSLKQNMYITGSGGTTNGFDASPANGATVYHYKESNKGGASNADFIPITSPSADYFNIGEGAYLFNRGKNTATDAYGVSRFSTSVTPEDNVVYFSGELNKGNITVNLSYTASSLSNANDGLNLVGNPYASTINLSSITGTSIGSSFYVLNPSTKQFSAYKNGVTPTGGASQYIASGQGFFVQATATGAKINFTESLKVSQQLTPSGTPKLLMSTSAAAKTVSASEIRLVMGNPADSTLKDDIVLSFKSGGQKEYNDLEDAYDMGGNSTVFLSSMSSDQIKLAINGMPSIEENLRVPLVANSSLTGNFTLSTPDLSSIEKKWNVFLVDHFTNDSTDLTLKPAYAFTIDRNIAATYDVKRFELVFHEKPDLTTKLLSYTGIAKNSDVILTWKPTVEAEYSVLFSLQRTLDKNNFTDIYTVQSDNRSVYYFTDSKLIEGKYYYRLKQDDGNGHITYSDLLSFTIENQFKQNESFKMYPIPVKNTYTIDLPNDENKEVKVRMIDAMGKVVQEYVSAKQSWNMDTNTLNPGVYIIELSNNASKKIIGRTKFIKI
ncbi:T9SS type A sorting domain-containing protein [Pedobacter sp. MW01-1-1]|uniref:T9SS type A sorting domain-containing protein n=1 Tax=Pedobacter sp. MW01-1-1 TaxID=3383027 RepID=UPI003FF0B050